MYTRLHVIIYIYILNIVTYSKLLTWSCNDDMFCCLSISLQRNWYPPMPISAYVTIIKNYQLQYNENSFLLFTFKLLNCVLSCLAPYCHFPRQNTFFVLWIRKSITIYIIILRNVIRHLQKKM